LTACPFAAIVGGTFCGTGVRVEVGVVVIASGVGEETSVGATTGVSVLAAGIAVGGICVVNVQAAMASNVHEVTINKLVDGFLFNI
jgi:hypothetical protein